MRGRKEAPHGLTPRAGPAVNRCGLARAEGRGRRAAAKLGGDELLASPRVWRGSRSSLVIVIRRTSSRGEYNLHHGQGIDAEVVRQAQVGGRVPEFGPEIAFHVTFDDAEDRSRARVWCRQCSEYRRAAA